MIIKKIDHLVITTTDISSCLSFYESLGFRSRSAEGRFELFAGDFKINVHLKNQELHPHAGNVTPGSADLCFEVEDLTVFQNLLSSNQMSLELGVVGRTGVNGPMSSVYLRDPDQNLLEFCYYSPINLTG